MSTDATATAWLIDLIRRTPILQIDTEAAQAVENAEAASYSRAVAAWLDEARIAVAEASTTPADDQGVWRVLTDPSEGIVPHGYPSAELVSAAIFLLGSR